MHVKYYDTERHKAFPREQEEADDDDCGNCVGLIAKHLKENTILAVEEK